MSTKTIDVNIPASAIEELAEAVTNHLDLDSAIDNSDLAGRVSDLESKVDDIDTSECVSDDDFRDLERRVEDLEDNKVNPDGEPIVHRIEKLEETSGRLVTLYDLLDRIETDLNSRIGGLNDRIRELENRVNKFDTVFSEILAAIKLNLF